MHQHSSYRVKQKWRRQTATRRLDGGARGERQIAAVRFHLAGKHSNDLARLEQISLVVVYDEPCTKDRIATRVCCYRPRTIPHGVEWAGNDTCILCKDLALQPDRFGRGQIFDLRRPRILRLALELDAHINRACRSRRIRLSRRFRLPTLWAGFSLPVVETIRGDGPEFEAICHKFGMTATKMFKLFERHHGGLRAYPLDWVSTQLDSAAAIFVDSSSVRQLQLFQLCQHATSLAGFQGAATYDFCSSRFRVTDTNGGPAEASQIVCPAIATTSNTVAN
jgi:hypothetical protein